MTAVSGVLVLALQMHGITGYFFNMNIHNIKVYTSTTECYSHCNSCEIHKYEESINGKLRYEQAEICKSCKPGYTLSAVRHKYIENYGEVEEQNCTDPSHVPWARTHDPLADVTQKELMLAFLHQERHMPNKMLDNFNDISLQIFAVDHGFNKRDATKDWERVKSYRRRHSDRSVLGKYGIKIPTWFFYDYDDDTSDDPNDRDAIDVYSFGVADVPVDSKQQSAETNAVADENSNRQGFPGFHEFNPFPLSKFSKESNTAEMPERLPEEPSAWSVVASGHAIIIIAVIIVLIASSMLYFYVQRRNRPHVESWLDRPSFHSPDNGSGGRLQLVVVDPKLTTVAIDAPPKYTEPGASTLARDNGNYPVTLPAPEVRPLVVPSRPPPQYDAQNI